MILVILGTQDKPFTRLIDIMEKYAKKHPRTKIIVQNGTTKYESKYLELHPFYTGEELDKKISEADLIITHGGVGTIMSALKKGKTIIATPRLKKYLEHTNDHQLQIIKEFAKDGYILPLYNLNKLEDTIKVSKKFKPKKLVSNNKHMCDLVSSEIDRYIGE